jgi:hypothetical protein
MERPPELQPEYESYLLRLWPAKPQAPQGCRMILQNVTTQQQYFFSDMTALLAFLTSILNTDDGLLNADDGVDKRDSPL